MKEIRERSLQLLVAKMQLGWTINDELRKYSDMLKALLTWFDVQQPSMQQEVLDLLLKIIKVFFMSEHVVFCSGNLILSICLQTKGGSHAAREYDIRKLLEALHKIKPKIEKNALEVYEDIVETLKFLNTVESCDHIKVPRLEIPSSSSIK